MRGGRRGLPAPRHHGDRALARPGRGDRPRRSGAHRCATTALQRHRPLPRRHVPGRRRAPAAQPRIDDNRRAIDEAAALGADCLVLVVGGLPRRLARHRAPPATMVRRRHRRRSCRMRRRRGMPLAHRAAAPDVRRGPRLREHARPGARPLRRDSAKASASRSTSTTSGGTRSSPRRSRGPAPEPHPRPPHLRLAGADPRPAARPRHDGRRRDRPAAASAAMIERPAFTGRRRSRSFPQDWWKRDGDEVLATCIERYDTLCRTNRVTLAASGI